MKFSLAAVAVTLASVAYGQSITDLPPCALNCFLPAVKADGCKLTDYKCHCEDQALIPKVQPCVQSKCSTADQQKVLTGVEKLCAANGVTLSITTSAPTGAPTGYTTPPPATSVYSTTQGYSWPSNSTQPPTSPISTPTAAAATAHLGGAVVLVAGLAAVAGL